MKSIELNVNSGKSNIIVGESIDNMLNYLPSGRTIIITDINLNRIYNSKIVDFDIIEIGVGESIKTLDTVNYIIQELIRLEADRSTFIVGFGGGLVCDVTGLVASVFMRGLKFGFVSTSLLSQVDASIGGKNGVNIGNYKNLFGVFNQPEFVLIDIELLNTLPDSEYVSGLAEIVKYGIIQDIEILKILEVNTKEVLSRDFELIYDLIIKSVLIKKGIVESDEKESGYRRVLNFGHTIGHAIEREENILHGEAVSVGMVKALEFSMQKCKIDEGILVRIKNLLLKLGLPVDLRSSSDLILENILKDKKKSDDNINFVLIEELGRPVIEKISIKEIKSFLNNL